MLLTPSEANSGVTPARINNLKSQIIDQFTNDSTLKNLDLPVCILKDIIKLSNCAIMNSFSHDIQGQLFHPSPSTTTTKTTVTTPTPRFRPNDFRSFRRPLQTSSNAIPLNKTRRSCLRKPSAPKKQRNRRVHFHPNVVVPSTSSTSLLDSNRSSSSSSSSNSHPIISTNNKNSSGMGSNNTNNGDAYNQMAALHRVKLSLNSEHVTENKLSTDMDTHIRSSSSSSSSSNNKHGAKKHIIFINDNSPTSDDKNQTVKPNHLQPCSTLTTPHIKIEPSYMEIDRSTEHVDSTKAEDKQEKMELENKQDNPVPSGEASSTFYNFGDAVENIYQNFIKNLAF